VAAGDERLPHGARLCRGDAEVGHVTSSAPSPRRGKVVALAYVRRGSQEPGTAVEAATASDRRTAAVTSLPFTGSGPAPGFTTRTTEATLLKSMCRKTRPTRLWGRQATQARPTPDTNTRTAVGPS